MHSPERLKASGLKLFWRQGLDLKKIIDYMQANKIKPKDLIKAHQAYGKNLTALQSLKLLTVCKLTKRPYRILQKCLWHFKKEKVISSYDVILKEKKNAISAICPLLKLK